MSEPMDLLHNLVDQHKDKLVESLQGCLRIPSKLEPAAGPNAPYGQPIRQALDYTLNLCQELGFRTKDVDGHAGHAEFGEGAEMVAALGHLDVVPEGDRWEHEPYGAEIDNGFIYARGASDDKGPTYAALFGAKALLDSGLPLSKRVRLIFGCDEESGFGCVAHYWGVANEERPVAGFTPDAVFPLIYAEKGIVNFIVGRTVEHPSGGLKLESFSGGRRSNMVPDSATATLSGTTSSLLAALVALGKCWDKNVSFEANEETITIHATGKSAHGSTPYEGDNAVARLARVLEELDLPDDKIWLRWVYRSCDPAGSLLGIEGRDDVAGPLTSNLGVFHYDGSKVTATFNIRYCVTWKIESILERLKPALEKNGWQLDDYHDSPPLYVPLDQEPAKTLLSVYQKTTGDLTSIPMTMGGGTYARATPNVVAYGAQFPDRVDGPAHEPDERISIDNLVKAAKIYALALYELAK